MASTSPVDHSDSATSTFASLAIREYRLLFIAGMVSFISVQGQIVARGWLANELSDSNTGLGGVYMAFGVPMLLSIPFGGVLADRLSKRSILLATQLALAATAGFLGVAVIGDFVQYWMLLLVSAVQGVAFAFLGPARIAMTTEVVGRGLLTNAMVLGQMSINSTRVIGPALAGLAIGVAWFGTAGVYLASAALALAALLLLLQLSPAPPRSTPSGRSPVGEFADAVRYVKRRSEVGVLVMTSVVVVMLGFPYLAFLPRVATELLDIGASGYGALSAASAVGALGISLWAAGRGSKRSPWRIQTASGLLFGVAIIALASSRNVVVALIAIAAVGAGASGFQAMNNSLALNLSDFEFHGRIQSLMMLSFSGFGMVALPLGALADAIGLRATMTLMGIGVAAAIVVSTLALRRARQRQSMSLA